MLFSGEVVITGQQLKPAMIIKLHANGLHITSAKFSIGGGEHDFSNHTHGDHDLLYLATPTEISGELTIKLQFRGEITEPMVGLYPCKFRHDDQDKVILATQFESHHAREVFPCIDEPSAKATFKLTLKTLKGEAVLANTELENQVPADDASGNWVESTFATTPVMSTYLLAFVTGELVASESKHANGLATRVWTTPLYADDAAFALDAATRVMDYYHDYFGIDYPLTKCDHVALPDFAAGAMENWGLITYRESMLVVNDANTSLSNKQSVALVVAHELAHQWFGNLVTMSWWTDLWLNEGFATWIEYLAVDHLFPEWKIWEQFVSDEYLPGMAMDSLASSHPIEVEIDDPDDIRSIFDAISYNKGASVIRMLSNYLSGETFRLGLQRYLNKYAYGNAQTEDLWACLEEASEQPVRRFMTAWTKQTGYPLVKAEVDVEAGSIKLAQTRYMLDQASNSDQLWPIPINREQDDTSMLLEQPSATWEPGEVATTKLNHKETGWYIVSYDEAHLKRLKPLTAQAKLGPLNRLGLVHDVFRLAKSGHQSTVAAFDFLEACRDETNAVVWEVILSQLSSVRSVFDDEELLVPLRRYTSDFLSKQYELLGWDERSHDTHFDKLLRPLVLSQVCVNNFEPAVKEALSRFEAAIKPGDIAADIRSLVCAAASRSGPAETYDKLLEWHQDAHSAQIKSQVSAGLCSSRRPEHIEHNFALLTNGQVKLQDVIQWVSYLSSNPVAKTPTWEWLRTHWDWIVSRFGTDIMTFSYFPKIIGNAFSDSAMIEAYNTFFDSVNTTGINQPVAQGLESLKWRSQWRQRDYEGLLKYLSQSGQSRQPSGDSKVQPTNLDR